VMTETAGGKFDQNSYRCRAGSWRGRGGQCVIVVADFASGATARHRRWVPTAWRWRRSPSSDDAAAARSAFHGVARNEPGRISLRNPGEAHPHLSFLNNGTKSSDRPARRQTRTSRTQAASRASSST
jgi:hypothetical protein